MQGPEKNSYKEFDNEKKIPAARKSPPLLHNFSNGPSLTYLSAADGSTLQLVAPKIVGFFVVVIH